MYLYETFDLRIVVKRFIHCSKKIDQHSQLSVVKFETEELASSGE